MYVHNRRKFSRVFLLTVLSLAVLVTSMAARADEELDREFTYCSKLIELGFSDFAEKAIERILKNHPEEKERAGVVKAEAMIAMRRFEDAEALIKEMPEASPKRDAILLALADGYYQTGEMDKCATIYDEFFSRYKEAPTDPDLLRFYRLAANKYAQMLSNRGRHRDAEKIYSLLGNTLEDDEMARQIKVSQVESLLRAARVMGGKQLTQALDEAEKLCNEVIWGGMDLWFGRAVASLAEVEILRGRRERAARLLSDNRRMLKKLDEVLEESGIPITESPYAGARWLLGELYSDEADLVLGSQVQRENEALRLFERAMAEYDYVWKIIQRVSRRDAVVFERHKEGKLTTGLIGTGPQRQKPYEDLIAELRKFDSLIDSHAGNWAKAVTKRVETLKDRISKMLAAIAEHPKEIGVTPTAEMTLGERFKGSKDLAHAKTFLGPENERQDLAKGLYTKSITEFYNVFAGYPGSDWSKTASQEVEELKEKLHRLTGKEIQIQTSTGGRRKIARVMLREAEDLFLRKEYEKAIDQYSKGVNEYPEGDESVVALINTMEGYAKLKDPLHVMLVADYISERFSDNPDAAKGLLRVGRIYFDENNRQMYTDLYMLYLSRFPKDNAAPSVLYMLGEQRWKVEDYGGAVPFYERLSKSYSGSSYYLKALNRIGWSYYFRKEFDQAAKTFAKCVEDAHPGSEKVQAKLCLADSYRQMGEHAKALKHYSELSKWLAEKGSVYTLSQIAIGRYRPLMEQAMFFRAYTLSLIDRPADKIPAFRAASIDLYNKFVEQFPNSELAPTALSSTGAILLGLNKSDEAARVYEMLSVKYPDSDAGKNAKFAMIRSLLEIGQTTRASEELKTMIANPSQFPIDHFLKVGQLMLEKGENESAALALSQAVKSIGGAAGGTQAEQMMEQRALIGLGKAYSALGRYQEAASSLSDLINRYPRSGLFYEARFLLGKAYRETGQLDKAIEVLTDVFKRASDQSLINRASMEYASIQIARGEKSDALASYQRIVLLGNVDDPKTRHIYEEALVKSVVLYGEMEKWQDALENCDRYLVNFPNGGSIVEVRGWRTKAVMQTQTAAAAGG